jgi:hypothetical protein
VLDPLRRLPVAGLALPLGLAVALGACGRKDNEPKPSEKAPAAATTGEADEGAAAEAEVPAPEPGKVIVAAGASSGLVDFVHNIPLAGDVWVGPMEGNGGREVLVYSPETPGPPRDEVRLVYHFHGTYSEKVQLPTEDAKKRDTVGWTRLQETIEAIDQLARERPYGVVLVYPLSAGRRIEPDAKKHQQRTKHYDRLWMVSDPEHGFRDSFDRMHAEVRERLKELDVDASRLSKTVVAEGHSAGGIALRNVARSGSRIVTEYLFLDASFQGWADGCLAALRENGSEASITLVVTQKGIADPFGKRDPWCESMPRRAQTYLEHADWCAGKDAGKPRNEQVPPGAEDSCDELMEAAELWPKSEAWCADYVNDLENTKGVRLVRTKVYHGDQPRHFAGGLEVPPAGEAKRGADR